MSSRLNSCIISGVIALSGCATAAQPKIVEKPAVQDTIPSRMPGESWCHYSGRLGINDPASCNAEEKGRKDLESIAKRIAAIVADVFYMESSHFIQNCLYVQQYDSTSEVVKKEKCINDALDIINQKPNFQKIDPVMQEAIRAEFRRRIIEIEIK